MPMVDVVFPTFGACRMTQQARCAACKIDDLPLPFPPTKILIFANASETSLIRLNPLTVRCVSVGAATCIGAVADGAEAPGGAAVGKGAAAFAACGSGDTALGC